MRDALCNDGLAPPCIHSYRRVLAQMASAPPFTISADYVRLQMASTARGRAAGSETSEEAVLQQQRAAAVKAAEVSSERRRAGHTPGDRVSMSQLSKDIQRDSVDVDGLALRGPQAGYLLAALAKRVAAAVKGEADDAWVTPRSTDTAKNFESAVLAFCREVLLCSSRTVTGGDAYDATEMVGGTAWCAAVVRARAGSHAWAVTAGDCGQVFGNRDLVIICPDTSVEV